MSSHLKKESLYGKVMSYYIFEETRHIVCASPPCLKEGLRNFCFKIMEELSVKGAPLLKEGLMFPIDGQKNLLKGAV